MIISEIYKNYKIPPHLQLHQLRVGGVAKLLAQNMSVRVNKNTVVTAGLLHDMGNIVKFRKFDEERYKPEGVIYWKEVQKKFIYAYGSDAHIATIKIAEELNLPKKIIEIVDNIELDPIKELPNKPNWELRICKYADHRVSLEGIVSIEDRLSEVRNRYLGTEKRFTNTWFDNQAKHSRIIERQIFNQSKIKPEAITDDAINPIIEELRNFEVKIGRGKHSLAFS